MDLSCITWRKASRSNSNGGACVEVARNLASAVAVRDSKNPDGPKLIFAPADWRTFMASIKAGSFDLS
jgi:ABC-type amino acid transport substrate-binding protein